MKNMFNTESVSEGHPDKIADQISELILDYFMEKDKNSHVACEVYITNNIIIVGGEIRSKIDFKNEEEEIRKKIINYFKNELKFDEKTWPNLCNDKLKILFLLQEQSSEICEKVLVKTGKKITGAGDNTVVFGFANNDKNNDYFPKFQTLANRILFDIQKKRKEKNSSLPFAPDGKIRITIEDEKLNKIILCQQFSEINYKNIKIKEEYKKNIKDKIIIPILTKLKINKDFKFDLICFNKGGPYADTGLTGRKLMIDTYGCFSRHGGGAFAGKDLTKTDKTLALFARFIAKHITALELTNEIEIQISSYIGQENNFDISYYVKNNKENKHELIKKVLDFFINWNLDKIISVLNLKEVKFIECAKYGYFGPDRKEYFWEKLIFIEKLKIIIGL